MFRKLALTLAATAALGAAGALAPTAASAAGGWHGHHGHHGWYGHRGWSRGFGVGFYPAYAAADCYVVRRVVYTPYGKRYRRVTVCD